MWVTKLKGSVIRYQNWGSITLEGDPLLSIKAVSVNFRVPKLFIIGNLHWALVGTKYSALSRPRSSPEEINPCEATRGCSRKVWGPWSRSSLRCPERPFARPESKFGRRVTSCIAAGKAILWKNLSVIISMFATNHTWLEVPMFCWKLPPCIGTPLRGQKGRSSLQVDGMTCDGGRRPSRANSDVNGHVF